MDATRRALEALREASEAAASIRPELTDEYLALIWSVEDLPENRSGADKTARARLLSTPWAETVRGPFPPHA